MRKVEKDHVFFVCTKKYIKSDAVALGLEFRKKREAIELPQEAVARILNMQQMRLSGIERGEVFMRFHEYKALTYFYYAWDQMLQKITV